MTEDFDNKVLEEVIVESSEEIIELVDDERIIQEVYEDIEVRIVETHIGQYDQVVEVQEGDIDDVTFFESDDFLGKRIVNEVVNQLPAFPRYNLVHHAVDDGEISEQFTSDPSVVEYEQLDRIIERQQYLFYQLDDFFRISHELVILTDIESIQRLQRQGFDIINIKPLDGLGGVLASILIMDEASLRKVKESDLRTISTVSRIDCNHIFTPGVSQKIRSGLRKATSPTELFTIPYKKIQEFDLA